MNAPLRRIAAAAGLAVLSLASSASWAASYTYNFNTFFDTSTTTDLLDTKTLAYSVATLTISDITGGVQVSLTQNNTAFPAKLGGTILDSLWMGGVNGTLANVSGTKVTGSTFSTTSPKVMDAGYTYPWCISFSSILLGGGISEGGTSTFKITGSGVTAAAFAKAAYTPMIDLTNVGSPYNTSFLGLGGGNVHFIGKLATGAVPEPGTYALMGLGLVGIGAVMRRRQAAA